MKNKILFIFSLSFLFLIKINNVYSQTNFITDSHIEYKITDKGKTNVTHTITINSKNKNVYAKEYILTLEGIIPENLKASESGNNIPILIEKNDNNYKININFESSDNKIKNSRTFIITYDTSNIAQKTGEVWEIQIPKNYDPNLFRDYIITLSIPKTFGEEAYISPESRKVIEESDRFIYTFEKEDVENRGIIGNFGKYQVFNFNLNYHLENTSRKVSTSLIALPPDTSTQKLFYKNIDPKPNKVTVNEDGNWIAEIRLNPKQKLDVEVTGWVQILPKPRSYINPDPRYLLENIKPQKYWQVDDPKIRDLAKTLKNPEDIYKYVVSHLNYDYERVKPDAKRLGAAQALINPKNAICTEYTDLFIALARAKGIPAREINGYAYSQNSQLQPLSLVADVLHSWPEYWDSNKNLWIPVDPTWGSTSGIDFFNSLDLKHFAFVIHGKDINLPYPPGSYKLGSNPQKDIFISFGKLPDERNTNLEVNYKFINKISLFNKFLQLNIKNNGLSAVYNINPKIFLDGNVFYENNINIIPPSSEVNLEIKIPFGIFSLKAPNSILIKTYHDEINVPINKNDFILFHMIIIFIILILFTIILNIKLGKFKIIPISKYAILYFKKIILYMKDILYVIKSKKI